MTTSMGRTDAKVIAYNAEALEIYNEDALIKCPKSGRTFTKEGLCRALRPALLRWLLRCALACALAERVLCEARDDRRTTAAREQRPSSNGQRAAASEPASSGQRTAASEQRPASSGQ